MIYCVLTVWSFLKRRREMSKFLNTNSQITFSRYFRLMVLSMMDTVLTIPLASFAIWLNAVESEVSPWRGLADAHFDFGRVDQIPSDLWRLSKWDTLSFYLDRWFIVVCALVFFGFFGFAEESRKNYSKMYWTVAKRFGYYPPVRGLSITGSSAYRTPNLPTMSTNSSQPAVGGLRVLVSQDAKLEKRDSFISSIGDLSSQFTVDDVFEDKKGSKAESLSSDSAPSSPDDVELAGLPHLFVTSPQVNTQPPVRPPRPDSLNIV